MPKTLLKTSLFLILAISLAYLTAPAHAQTPTPPTPTFWEENSQAIISALIGLVFGGILAWVLKPVFEKLGNALAGALSKLGSGWGFKRRYLTHLIEEYRGLNIRGFKTRAPVTVELEQVYVSLRAQVPDYALGRQAPPRSVSDRHWRSTSDWRLWAALAAARRRCSPISPSPTPATTPKSASV